MMLRLVFLLGLTIATILPTACANTASGNDANILTFELTVTFRGNVDTDRYRYYIFFSDNTRPLLPSVPPERYFPTPGRGFDDANTELLSDSRGIQAYYADFFSTWTDYVVVGDDGNGNAKAFLYKSNSNGFDATTTDNFTFESDPNFSALLVNDGNPRTLKIQFTVQSLSPANPSALSFEIGSSKLTQSPVLDPLSRLEAGHLRDILEDTNPVIRIENNQLEGPLADSQDFLLDADTGIDILSWTARIFQ